MNVAYDVAIVGGGPVGSVAALSFARSGARCLLIEANPHVVRPFAGEWLHPAGVRVLRDLQVPLCAANATVSSGVSVNPAGRGFVVFPEDRSAPISLDYPGELRGLAFEHHELVNVLRGMAADHPLIDYAAGARVNAWKPSRTTDGDAPTGTLTITDAEGAVHDVQTARVVGADGRSSWTRRLLGLPEQSTLISYNGGVRLTGVELPKEGYGHVILGGPGPVLLYRLSPEVVRLSIDVAPDQIELRRDPQLLLECVSPWLPDNIVEALKRALQTDRPVWMPNRFRPRSDYGSGPVALIGDAAGYFHPLTASGMTMGFLDAKCLVQSDSVSDYARRREAASYVPELLSNALYQAFTGQDAGTARLRRGVYRLWRGCAAERERLMRILGGEDTGCGSFASATVRIGWEAACATDPACPRPWQSLRDWQGLGLMSRWALWPLAGMLPGSVRRWMRPRSSPQSPFMSHRGAKAIEPQIRMAEIRD